MKKIKDTLKATSLLCLCIFFPLWVASTFIRMSVNRDAINTVESFMYDEGVGIAKYMGLQLENSENYVKSIMSTVNDASLKDANTANNILKDLQKKFSDVMTIVVYNSKGKYFASSNGELSDDLNLNQDSIKNIGDKCLFFIMQLEDSNDIVIKLICLKHNANDQKNDNNMYFEFMLKWDKYERYMKNLEIGSFPRMLYILSPDCRRYISLN
ncbi:MAG: hypothetical protein LBT67_03010, partial [Holosporaceae bacterium]|nr:hypothetical protein [Holosporaceae bacterium]